MAGLVDALGELEDQMREPINHGDAHVLVVLILFNEHQFIFHFIICPSLP